MRQLINIFGFETKRFSRRSTLALPALGLIAAVPLASSLLLTDKHIPGLSEIAASALSIVNGRSPGERITGELTKTKPARQLAAKDIRPRRGARRIIPARQAAPQDLPEDLTLPLAQLSGELPKSTFEDALSPGDQLAVLDGPFIPGAGGETAFLGPIGGGPGGGPGDGGNDGDGPPDEGGDNPAVVPSAVPEPGTWAMMLIGFSLCGAALRRRRAGADTRPAPTCVAA